jgi:hypothetical protein
MKRTVALAVSTYFCLSLCNASALTVDELHAVAGLTPQNFSSYFADFSFTFRADVQNPADFLAQRDGDCDDFATLAAAELSARGYTPRLVAVRMKREVHVICYIAEANAYLDYNLRAKGGLVPCGPSLDEIAASVIKSFKNSPWTSASEFTYDGRVKRLVQTTLPGAKQTKPTILASILTGKN